MGIDVRVEPRGYEVEFAPLGCMPGPLRYGRRRIKKPVKCFLLAERESQTSAGRTLIGGLLQRYFLRGVKIPPTPEVEELALRKSGVIAHCERAKGEDGGYVVLEERRRPDFRQIASRLAQLNCREIPVLESSLQDDERKLFDSPREERFLTEWMLDNLQERAAYVFPQYHLRNLTGDANDQQRVDFLFYDGTGDAIAIELDGPEHDETWEMDLVRERTLTGEGVRTVRVPNFEVEAGEGAQLQEVEEAVRREDENGVEGAEDSVHEWAKVVLCCDEALSVQYALTRLLQRGRTDGARMLIEVGGCTEVEVIKAAVREWGQLGRAMCQIHGITADSGVPESIDVREVGENEDAGVENKVQILFERVPAWWHKIPEERPDVIVRPAESLVEPTVEIKFPRMRGAENQRLGARAAEEQKAGLRTFLRDAFRKRNFREAQEEAIIRCIAGNDTVVLLPTGAGKSLIYQMAGLVKPGLTLVVTPLVALIEDQIIGLEEMGINTDEHSRVTRVEKIIGRQDQTARQKALERLRDGTALILFVTPERLLMSEFQQQLGVQGHGERVGLVVIDEAHCVSEWGHYFRPAYLQTGQVLRELLGQPTLLALTGTASRAVFRDMMAHLEIDRGDVGAAIRPITHDRPEIEMQQRYCTTQREADIARIGMLTDLPQMFEVPEDRFWQARGNETICGLIFMPTVSNTMNNIDKGVELVREAGAGANSIVTYASTGVHSDGRHDKAKKYKSNEKVVMVATSAYGMGIDKPNVRWVMHPHLTMSLEGYYQQIGRAGRDRQEAQAIAVMYEKDPERTDSVLDPEKRWEEAQQAYEESRGGVVLSQDDVSTALYFHFDEFKGREREKSSLRQTIEALQPSEGRGLRYLPRGRTEFEKKEKERDLGRLSRLGIVKYFVVDSGTRFQVFVDRWEAIDLENKLEEYVKRFDRAQAANVKEDLHERLRQAGEESEVQARVAAEVLVDYLYSSVERARRRAIYETVLMARTCQKDEQIRQRMLGYLSEGRGAEILEELLDAERVEWDKLLRLFDDVASARQSGAGKLRGMFSRALESNPEHPAVLLGRATAEAVDGGKFEVVEQNVRAALRALPKYFANSEPSRELGRMAAWIRAVGETTGGEITRVTQWIYWQPLGEHSAHEQEFAKIAQEFAGIIQKWDTEPHEEPLAMLFRVGGAIDELGVIIEEWANNVDWLRNESEAA